MSLISKILSKRDKIIYLNSPEFLLNLDNNLKQRKKNLKISQRNIKNLTMCLNCMANEKTMKYISNAILNEQAEHYNTLVSYSKDKKFAGNVLYVESSAKLLSNYILDENRVNKASLRFLTVQWLEFLEQYLIYLTEIYCLNNYNFEVKWEEDSFYIGKGIDQNSIIEFVLETIDKIHTIIFEISDLDNNLDQLKDLIDKLNVHDIVSDIIFDDNTRQHCYIKSEVDNFGN